jgi:hypothetical protein
MPTPVDERNALWLPIAKQMPLHISRLGKMSTMLVENKKLAQDMAAMFGGRAAKPQGIVTMPSADGTTPIMIAGMGQCEAAELEDIALEALEKDAEQIKKTGTAVDFAAERERRGYAPVETFDTRYREYLAERAEYGRRNLRTAITTPYGQHVREHGMGKGQSMSVVPSNYPKENPA